MILASSHFHVVPESVLRKLKCCVTSMKMGPSMSHEIILEPSIAMKLVPQ